MTKVEIDNDYSDFDQVGGTPLIGQLIVFQKQMAKIQTRYKCNIMEAKDHGRFWIMCTPAQWMLKGSITTNATPADIPGLYTSNANSLKTTYK